MTVILCLDDKNGMCFNRRRQSRDRLQVADMCRLCAAGELYCAPYSAPLFEGAGKVPRVCEDHLARAGEGDICFVEQEDLLPYAEKIKTLIVYRWNRTYPRDRVLTLSLANFRLTERVEFPGHSHEKITRERYEK